MKALLTFAFSWFCFHLYSQNVGINNDGSPPDPKAILDVKSISKGILLPRMSSTDRGNITSPPQGLIVYQTDAPEGLYYQAAVTGFINWKRIVPTDGQFWTGSISGGHIFFNSGLGSTSNVGIGTTLPQDAGLVVDKKVGAVNCYVWKQYYRYSY